MSRTLQHPKIDMKNSHQTQKATCSKKLLTRQVRQTKQQAHQCLKQKTRRLIRMQVMQTLQHLRINSSVMNKILNLFKTLRSLDLVQLQ